MGTPESRLHRSWQHFVGGAVCFRASPYWLREKGWMQLEVINWIKK